MKMDNLAFLKSALEGNLYRGELGYLYQIEISGEWHTFAADGYVMHVVKGAMFPTDMPVIVTERSIGDIEKAEGFLEKNRANIASMITPEYENLITLYFDKDHLQRILNYADCTSLALLIQRPRKPEMPFDFADGVTCFAYIVADNALFCLGNVSGSVAQNTTVYLSPDLLKRALNGLMETSHLELTFDAAHTDKPVTIGCIYERFAVIMPMNEPHYRDGAFLADMVGGYGEKPSRILQSEGVQDVHV